MNLDNLTGFNLYRQSVVELDGVTYFLARNKANGDKMLGVHGDTAGFEGTRQNDILFCPLTSANAAALRS